MPAFWGNIAKNRPCDLQVYSNLSNCKYRIFVKEIQLEIHFIERRTTYGNKEVSPKPFSTIFIICENTI